MTALPDQGPALGTRPGQPAATPYGSLVAHAQVRPDALALAIWHDGAVARSWSWRALRDQVDRRVQGLRELGVGAGDRVVMVLPNDETFPMVLLALSALGAVAVPAPVPGGRVEAFQERLRGIVEACGPAVITTTEAWLETVRELPGAARPGGQVVAASQLRADHGGGPGRTGAPDDVVLLQFTSGSTKRPRGVIVTAATIAVNCAQATQAYQESGADTAVTWVPLFHDMGMITGLMRPLHHGYPSVLLTPEEFVRRPVEWLRAIDRCGGTVSSAPNFAYDLCVRKVPAAEVATLDLSRWRVARNAGEVVKTSTLRRFADHLAPAGFREAAFAPSYGLAEATLTVTTAGPAAPPISLALSASALARGEVVEVTRAAPDGDGDAGAAADPADVRWLTSSGVPVDGTSVRIAEPRCPGGVGEIHISGPQLAPGYWGPSDGVPVALREQTRHGRRWHLTGDLGFLRYGHLFVLGRADDTLTVQGRNFFAIDIATICAEFPELRAGRVAAFALGSGLLGSERAAPEEPSGVRICAEVSNAAPTTRPQLDMLAKQVRGALVRKLDLFVHSVHLVPKGALPVTTSGKVRVRETQRRYREGLLGPQLLNP